MGYSQWRLTSKLAPAKVWKKYGGVEIFKGTWNGVVIGNPSFVRVLIVRERGEQRFTRALVRSW